MRSVTYDSGRTCSDEPPAGIAAAYERFAKRSRRVSAARWKQLWERFLAEHHLRRNGWLRVLQPRCAPVGWVAPKVPKLTPKQVASPIRVSVVRARRYCHRGPGSSDVIIACDNRVPAGYTPFDPGGVGPQLLVTISFVARRAVTGANSWYQWELGSPARDSLSSSTQGDIRRGQRIRFTDFVDAAARGVYSGTISFVQDAGRNGSQPAEFYPHGAGILVGRFSFRLPLKH